MAWRTRLDYSDGHPCPLFYLPFMCTTRQALQWQNVVTCSDASVEENVDTGIAKRHRFLGSGCEL